MVEGVHALLHLGFVSLTIVSRALDLRESNDHTLPQMSYQSGELCLFNILPMLWARSSGHCSVSMRSAVLHLTHMERELSPP